MSPKGPFRWGSTTFNTNPVAAAASKAFPPASNMRSPTAEAIQCVLATIPNVPVNSGRVVNDIAKTPKAADLIWPYRDQKKKGRFDKRPSITSAGSDHKVIKISSSTIAVPSSVSKLTA